MARAHRMGLVPMKAAPRKPQEKGNNPQEAGTTLAVNDAEAIPEACSGEGTNDAHGGPLVEEGHDPRLKDDVAAAVPTPPLQHHSGDEHPQSQPP